jgi:hypothetical protein
MSRFISQVRLIKRWVTKAQMFKMKIVCLLIALLIFSRDTIAQLPLEDFSITVPYVKINNSLYNKIELLDSRIDVTDFGIIQRSESPYPLKVLPTVHLAKQLNNIVSNLLDSSARDGQLLFQLRKFRFAVNGGRNELGYFFLKADMYAKVNRSYQKVNSIDTFIFLHHPEVANYLFLRASIVVDGFLTASLTKSPLDNDFYTLDDLLNVEKRDIEKLKSRTTTGYVDGLYLSYNSFINQTPDKQITVKLKNDWDPITVYDENNKKIKVDLKSVYTLVYRGKMYLPTDLGYYPLIME